MNGILSVGFSWFCVTAGFWWFLVLFVSVGFCVCFLVLHTQTPKQAPSEPYLGPAQVQRGPAVINEAVQHSIIKQAPSAHKCQHACAQVRWDEAVDEVAISSLHEQDTWGMCCRW